MSFGTVQSGWVTGARRCPTPNADQRPPGTVVDLLVVHNISLPPGEFGGDRIERLFTNTLDPAAHPYFAQIAHLRVSAHFLIRRDGELVQFAATDARAWHAGASTWCGRDRCNDFSLGVELEGADDVAYADAQYAALTDVTRTLRAAYPAITSERIVGHSDIAPGRKTDPGPAFDWERFRAQLTGALA